MDLRILTAGESHNKAVVAILDGFPANFKVDEAFLNEVLKRRQIGYGRGGRMKIEQDRVEFLSGVKNGYTIGSPITLVVWNRDYANWQEEYESESGLPEKQVFIPRPGHADIVGYLKYNYSDIRPVIERASARSTVVYTAAGAICASFLQKFGIESVSHVLSIGDARISGEYGFEEIKARVRKNAVFCVEDDTAEKMRKLIDTARSRGDTLGGVVEVRVRNVPPGLGSYVQWDRRLDAAIAQMIMAIPSAKAVEIGEGISAAQQYGSQVHDEIQYGENKYRFKTNNSGGILGGITNGDEIKVRAYLKPIPTLRQPLKSVDLRTKEAVTAHFERSDVCAVPAATIIAEMMVNLVITRFFLQKFGGDTMDEIISNYERYMEYLKQK